jgi:hypothetical protein
MKKVIRVVSYGLGVIGLVLILHLKSSLTPVYGIEFPPIGTTTNIVDNVVNGIMFDRNESTKVLPIFNSLFEEGATIPGWTRSEAISPIHFQSFSCTQYPPCAIGDKFLKVEIIPGNGGDAYVVSDWIDIGKPVNNVSYMLYFYAKSHSSPRNLYIDIQGYPTGSNYNKNVRVGPFAVTNTEWKLFSAQVNFTNLSGYTQTKVRVVLRPLQSVTGFPAYDPQPIYYNNIMLVEQPLSITTPLKVDVYDVGADKLLNGTNDTFLGRIDTNASGAFSFTIPSSMRDNQLHNIMFMAINRSANGGNDGTNRNITLGKTISYTSSPTITPTVTVSPPVSPVPGCLCNTDDTCATVCTFDKFATPITYTDPIKCSLSSSFFANSPSTENKTSWCQKTLRTKGDTDGNGTINNTDYFYYVAAVNGGKIPVTANPDFNGDGEVGASDRMIIVKSLNP